MSLPKRRRAAKLSTAAVLASTAALSFTSCLRPGEERAERELSIGSASLPELSVRVGHGLAAVRALTPDHVRLWSSAPGFELTLDARAARDVALVLENCLPDAELVELTSGRVLEAVSGADSTKKEWALALAVGAHRFRLAAPDADTSGGLRFALLSDVQEALDRVGDVFRRINAEPGVRFLLGAGDLTEEGSVEELAQYQRELAALSVPYYTTLGNHELGTSPPTYLDWFGRANFQFTFRGVVFTLLDSASASLDPLVYDWLDGWLAGARERVHVVAMHIPPLDPAGVRNGAFASRAEASALLARLAEEGVDLTLYGHIHSYYSFDNAGIPAFISGGGGAIPERFDNIGRHFLVIDVHATNGVTSTRVVRVD